MRLATFFVLLIGCGPNMGSSTADESSGGLSFDHALACAAGYVRYCPEATCDATPTTASVCADYIGIAGCGGCQFYACREAEHSCGPEGYYLGFGEKYCNRFILELRPHLSAAGQKFLDLGRDCLMRAVDTQIPITLECSEVREQALQSHVACYRDNGFCDLPLDDRVKFIFAVDTADLDLVSAIETELACS